MTTTNLKNDVTWLQKNLDKVRY